MAERGLLQEDLAKRIGSKMTIVNWEKKKGKKTTKKNLEKLRRIMRTLLGS
jgi:DNA-binding XRE family transcriptional regulator